MLNLFTLIVFIIVSSFQIIHSSKNLDYADSTNAHTREALRAGQIAARITQKQLIRDSIGRIEQNIKDSLFIKSQEKRDSFYFTSTKKSLRPYIIFTSETFSYIPPKVNSKDCPKITLSYKNVGKTPAYNIVSFIRYEIGTTLIDSSLFEKDITIIFPFTLGENETSSQFRERQIRTFSKQDSVNIAKQKEVIYWGIGIYYTDIFGDEHTLECIAAHAYPNKASIRYYKRND